MSGLDGAGMPQDGSPTRRQRLLSHRHARFPAKKLSLSGLSNKLTQLTAGTTVNDFGINVDVENSDAILKNNNNSNNTVHTFPRRQENKLVKSRSTGTIGRRGTSYSLNVLEEISNTTRHRISRRSEIPIFEDNPHRPLLGKSSPNPWGSTPNFDQPRNNFSSPGEFDDLQNDLNMRLKELSVNERSSVSPVEDSSPRSLKARRRQKSKASFDADEYIEHIEKELQTVRDEAYSPLSKRPVKEKLRSATREIDRLQQELTHLRERFETEVKKAVEHKTATEVELRRKVRDLETELAARDTTIEDLQHQHEEKRLDTNIIETLKATIDRLELEKQDMQMENLSMTRRNEALAQLLAMSPTRLNEGFELRSPTRERKPGRPMSLIIPRLPTSPTTGKSPMSYVVTSPRGLGITNAGISPLKLSPEEDSSDELLPQDAKKMDVAKTSQPSSAGAEWTSPPFFNKLQRRWTTKHGSAHDRGMSVSSIDDYTVANKRKPRRFVAGSTQLKPLLLSTLSNFNENALVSAFSPASSPRSILTPPEYAPEQTASDEPHTTINHVDTSDRDEAPTTPSWTCVDGGRHGSLDIHDSRFAHLGQQNTRDLEDDVSLHPLLSDDDGHENQRIPSSPPLFEPQHTRIELPRPLFSADSATVLPVPAPSPSINHRKRRELASSAELDVDSPRPKALKRIQSLARPSSLGDPIAFQPEILSHQKLSPSQKRISQIRSADNLVDFLRQKDFAARPLATMTIKTVYTIISTLARSAKEFKQDPFALARKVMANAWYMNWKMFGKLSWYVLGLFIQPPGIKAKVPIDWDSYDGESIASRYCSSESGRSPSPVVRYVEHHRRTSSVLGDDAEERSEEVVKHETAGWARSLLLWGKFSAALMLAVGGAVIKGPGAMLKEPQKKKTKHHHHRRSQLQTSLFEPPTQDEFCFRSGVELPRSMIFDDFQSVQDTTLKPRPLSSRHMAGVVTSTATPVKKGSSTYREALHQSFLDAHVDDDDDEDDDDDNEVQWPPSPEPSLTGLQEGSVHTSSYYRDATPSIFGDTPERNPDQQQA